MMDRPFALTSREKRIEAVTRRLAQHHVDVQRLWKRIPQGTDDFGQAKTATAIVTETDPGESGGSMPGPLGTGGTRRCSQGRFYYTQQRYAGRGRSVPGSRSTNAWETSSSITGPYDSVGATVALTSYTGRSQLLTADRFDFNIPSDSYVHSISWQARWKLVWLNDDGAGGSIPDAAQQLPFVQEDRLGVEGGSTGNLMGPWIHRNGIRIGGRGYVNGSEAAFSPSLAYGGLNKWRGDQSAAPNDPGASYGEFYGALTEAGGGWNFLYDGQHLPTADEVNADDFGWMLQLKTITTFLPPGVQMRAYVDGIRMTVLYSIYHQTGCTGESF